jgi:flagellar biogenesis protein FliO
VSALEQTLAALFFCGLLAILVWLLRKGKLASFAWSGAPSQGAGQLDVVARRALTSQHMLHLVSAAGETFLVATHPHGVEIAQFPASRKLNRLPAEQEERGSH